MTNEVQRLIASLTASDQLKGYLSNLQQLKDEGAVTEEQYATAKEDYDGRLASATEEVGMLRSALSAQVQIVRHDLDSLRLELGMLDVRNKAGEINLARFRNEEKKLKTRVDQLEQNEKELENLIAADSAAGLAAPETTAKPSTATRRKRRVESPTASERAQPSIPSTSSSRMPTGGLLSSKPRIAALVVAVVLLISIRLPWLAPSAMLASNTASEAGVTVSFLVGLGGLICGLAGIGIAFIRSGRTRGTLYIVLGVLAAMALVAAVALGELPLHSSYFRQLIVVREGLYTYACAALVLMVLGAVQRRED